MPQNPYNFNKNIAKSLHCFTKCILSEIVMPICTIVHGTPIHSTHSVPRVTKMSHALQILI